MALLHLLWGSCWQADCWYVTPPHSPSSSSAICLAGFRFPSDVIVLAVRWYLRFGLSYREVEELLAERGVEVDHVTIYRWVQRFTPLLTEAARPCRHAVGDRWQVDETDVKVADRWRYIYRAIDHGRLKARLGPLRGLNQDRRARVSIAGHAFVQNLRRRHHELAVAEPTSRRVAVAFDELVLAI
jgi:transposase-like protein